MKRSISRVLEGHEELVRCIRFDKERIVSGAYDGKIKVWDLRAALDPRSPAGTLCLRTLVVRVGEQPHRERGFLTASIQKIFIWLGW